MTKRNWNATQHENDANRRSEKLLQIISAKLEERSRAGSNGERNWGHAGDADHVKSRLLDIVMGWELRDDESEKDCRDRIINDLQG